jgi:hypothetical protein
MPVTAPARNPKPKRRRIAGNRSLQASHWAAMPRTKMLATGIRECSMAWIVPGEGPEAKQ